MKSISEKRVLFLAVVILIAAFLATAFVGNKQDQYVLEQHMQVQVGYAQDEQGTQPLVHAKCESFLRPISQITGAVFGVDWCEES